MGQKAFKTLANLAAVSRQSARGLPAQQDLSPRWSGVGFALLGLRFAAPMAHISEMLELPKHTRLPGVQPWVMGVANVRGRLLPLFNMTVFFGQPLSGQKSRRRVLILESENLYSGLVVEEAFGVQHFMMDAFSSRLDSVPDSLSPYLEGCYRGASGQPWYVFNMAKLALDPRFLNAAA